MTMWQLALQGRPPESACVLGGTVMKGSSAVYRLEMHIMKGHQKRDHMIVSWITVPAAGQECALGIAASSCAMSNGR